MTINHLLHDLVNCSKPQDTICTKVSDEETGKVSLLAYQSGHQDGWEDCEKALLEQHNSLANSVHLMINQLEEEYTNLHSRLLNELKEVLSISFKLALSNDRGMAYADALDCLLRDRQTLYEQKNLQLLVHPKNSHNLNLFISRNAIPVTLVENTDHSQDTVIACFEQTEAEINVEDYFKSLCTDSLDHFSTYNAHMEQT